MSEPTSAIDYNFPTPTLNARLKRVERTVQFTKRGQVADVSTPQGSGFRTVAASQVDRDGNLIINDAKGTLPPQVIVESGLHAFGEANTVVAGPPSGSAAALYPRLLIPDDLPVIPESKVSGLVADLAAKVPLSYLDTDATMAADSDTRVPSQKAVKTYVDSHAGGGGGTLSIDGGSASTLPSGYVFRFDLGASV